MLTSDELVIEEPERPKLPGIIIVFLIVTAGTWVLTGITYTFVKDSDTKVATEPGEQVDSDHEEEEDRHRMRQA